MRTVGSAALRYENADVDIFEIFPERWDKKRDFSLYKNNPRPCSALFLICSDIEVSFFCEGFPTVTAKRGEVVFIPKNICYTARITKTTTAPALTYTVNLELRTRKNEVLHLSENISVIAYRKDNLFEIHMNRLSDTVNRTTENERNLLKTKAELYTLLDLICTSNSREEDFYYPIRKGIDTFLDEWKENEKIKRYADICGVSETYFYRCFKKWCGSSPIEYRTELRLSNAEGLVRCTDMQIQEISSAVGFDDPFYFSQLFAKKFGMSPQKYRKNISKNN